MTKTNLIISLLCLALPWLFKYLMPSALFNPGLMQIQALICLYSFCLALAVGAQFPIASRAQARHSLSRLYTADFIGASIGALLTGALLAPLLGIAAVCGIVGGLNFMASLFLWFKGKYEQI